MGHPPNRATFFADPFGLFSRQRHYDMTYEIALQEFGPRCVNQAKQLASLTAGQDKYSENPLKDIVININVFGRAWKQPGIHFPGTRELNALDEAIASCDLNLLGQGLHSGQDFIAHAGYSKWTHAIRLTFPDTEAAGGPELETARQLTQSYVRLYKLRCLKCCSQ